MFIEYTDFVKGEPVRSWRDVKIEVTHPIPVMTIENNPELIDILPLRNGSEADFEKWKSFMKEHNGEYIEFNGTITDWYDELWYASGISFTVSFEEYEDISFSWSGLLTSEFGYKNNYSTGCVEKGITAHVIAKIIYTEESCKYELESIKLGK